MFRGFGKNLERKSWDGSLANLDGAGGSPACPASDPVVVKVLRNFGLGSFGLGFWGLKMRDGESAYAGIVFEKRSIESRQSRCISPTHPSLLH